ncbi:MAG: hypothetical protein ACI8UR_001672 [Natronomonas sp.]|jgi:hypothetical protein|uniref:hypothetical protein n=1 Tax=Natronomonas sp. TaxID=2184060 RepID=UPI0039895E22
MAFPTTPAGAWTSEFGLPSRLFGTDGSEEGFEIEEIDAQWDGSRLCVAAEGLNQYSRIFRA